MEKININTQKDLDTAHEDVPANYYQKAIKNNLFQRFWHMQRIDQIKHALSDIKAEKVLDVGCHSGRLTYEIKKKLPKAQVIGIDISKRAIMHAQKKYKKNKFYVEKAESIPFKSNSFDLITCFEVLEHVHRPQKVINEIKRLLKTNGHLLLIVPSENNLFKIIWYFWTRFGPGKVWHHTHIQKFNNGKLEKILEKNEFVIKKKKFFILNMLLLIHANKK